MRRVLQRILIGCLMLSLIMAITGCKGDSVTLKYSKSFQSFSEFDKIEPLLTRYYAGLRRAVEKTNQEDLNTFLIDEDTQLAQYELETFFNEYEQYKLNTATDEDIKIYNKLHEIFLNTIAVISAYEVEIYIFTTDSSFIKPHSGTPEKLIEGMKEHLDNAYKKLATG